MADEIVDLRSVNWVEGMFLTPAHFERQERYVDSLMLWLLHHLVPSAGLVGGGVRVDPADRGAARFDPIVEVDESDEVIKVSVMQCRAITQGGGIVEIDSSRPVAATFPKKALEGANDVGIYIVARAHDKEPDERVQDEVNPGLQVVRAPRYEIKLDVSADEAHWSVLLTRLRRAPRGVRFEMAPGFIPPCAFMSSHSELMQAFRRTNERVAAIADRYGALHRAMVDFVHVARPRVNVEQDLETLEFVSRMVVTLEECAYDLLDPLQSPARFFQQTARLARNAALYLSLSPPTQEYFRQLGALGEVEFSAMLEQEGRMLENERRWSIHDDLSVEVQKVTQALDRVERLEQALEGKYLDYRTSPTLESLNFVFDCTVGEPVLYNSLAKPARPQAQGQELTFVFAPPRGLEGRETYRIILVGDKQAHFAPGDRTRAELRINPGEGYGRPPEYHMADCEIEGQRNFAIDFKAPEDIVTINDIRVSVPSTQPIRSAMLYVRARLITSPGAPAPAMRPSIAGEPRMPRPQPDAPRTPPPGRLGSDRERQADAPTPPPPPQRRSRLS